MNDSVFMIKNLQWFNLEDLPENFQFKKKSEEKEKEKSSNMKEEYTWLHIWSNIDNSKNCYQYVDRNGNFYSICLVNKIKENYPFRYLGYYELKFNRSLNK